MKQYAQLAVSLLIAAACTSRDQRSPTAPESGPAYARQPAASVVITDLGTLGGTTSDAVSLNTPSAGNRLLIVGSSNDRAGITHAAYWYVNTATGARQVGALPAPAGDGQSGAGSVNQAEQIVGGIATTAGALSKPVQWANTGSSPSFLDITGFTSGGASKITPTGETMGLVSNADGTQAAIWSGSNLTLLPGLGAGAFIEDANVNGVIVGISKYTNTGNQRAVVWQNGSITQLPDGGWNSFALGINDDGIIVGMDGTQGIGARGVRWLPPTTPGGVYTMENLGVSGDAYDINNVGEIVGMNCVPGQVCKPFYWRNGVLRDLPMLQPVRGGGARAINENGDVIGWSRLPSNYQHAVLWTHVR
jgi:probable HAF family extracellular repeat protein